MCVTSAVNENKLRISDMVIHLPYKPLGEVYSLKTPQDDYPLFVLCKYGKLFGVYNTDKKVVEYGGYATKEEAKVLLLQIVKYAKQA